MKISPVLTSYFAVLVCLSKRNGNHLKQNYPFSKTLNQPRTWHPVYAEEARSADPSMIGGNSEINPYPFAGGQKYDTAPTKLFHVHTPLPGIVIKINVKPGEEIDYGCELMVLESMGMRHAISASQSARIEKVYVSEGDMVLGEQVVIEFSIIQI